MSHFENRNKIVDRIEKELVGPGSDIFFCNDDLSDEVIEGKPLQRYFSAILFPKQLILPDIDTGKEEYSTNDDDNDSDKTEIPLIPEAESEKQKSETDDDGDDEADTVPKYNSNAFYPSHFGFSFCVNKSCRELNLTVSFGNYKKAKTSEISLPYTTSDWDLLSQFGFGQFVAYDEVGKTLRQVQEIKRKVKGKPTTDYLALQSAFKAMSADHRNSSIFKHLSKLLYKDKYKRFDNEISITATISGLLSSENNHKILILSQQQNAKSENWHKDNIDNLILHLKLYNTKEDKYFIKAVIENKYAHRKDQFSLSKEKLNQLALFQTEIKVNCPFLLSFRDYRPHLYKTAEDKMLDYLFRNKLAYGIGHNTSCTWEKCEQNKVKPSWIKTTFIPSYSVKSQSTETDTIAPEILSIKNISSFGKDKKQVISNLNKIAGAYSNWIVDEKKEAAGNKLGEVNIQKCNDIRERIKKGIELLSQDDIAYKAFQLANTAIYIQMFQNEYNFAKKDGYEVFEGEESPQLKYSEYANAVFPHGKQEPSWRPFQLAFILQCIPSFVEENSPDKDLVDLLYFPTGGGKTEAYLAISAFLIFWRRFTFPKQYDGVNIIIRYTLRLLSAQQFERATKLILACEFIRMNQKELGENKITIGFWIGSKTIPNKHRTPNGTGAYDKFNKTLKLLNEGTLVNNPFQVSNCQWCNTKMVSKTNATDTHFILGHRHNGKKLSTFCNNPKCVFSENTGGLPIVLIDEDVYNNPPTMLFGTVDKFAQLAWEGNASSLFNLNECRKPELIIQDELHLLNGPLGSLVGLFENVILSLCTTVNQKPKIIASTATIKNVEAQIQGLYGREARIFPQYASNSDDTFFSKTLEESKRKYIGILPTGKTTVVTNLQLLSALLYARLEIWEQARDKADADQFWTLLTYFKSLKEIGRFSNKINTELKPIIKQLQVRYLKNQGDLPYNYWKLSAYDRIIELTSRIPNEKIKKNLDKLDKPFTGNLKESNVAELVLATNMISVGLDVGRLGIMVMNGMPPNTAEYIQASSRVARKNEGLVATLFDPFNTRDLSYFEDFVQFHKTFYKQVEPLSVTPFADSALDKMLFTLIVAYFRHKMNFPANNMASAFIQTNVKTQLHDQFSTLFKNHPSAMRELPNIILKIEDLLQNWQYRVDAVNDLKFFWYQHPRESLMKSMQEKTSEDDVLVAMQSMRNVEPNAEVLIKQQ